jgi:GT2 family glycosyltransferase
MARLSVIIVNYNVRYFLEQCLWSVQQAAQGLDIEVIVVDNASSDDSLSMLAEKFPEVKLITNLENTGFSKANNQGIREATGDYMLLLNPDTLVREDSFRNTLAFMDTHPECGALGVRMLDGSGNFLPESKRGLPTPAVALFKMTGLAALFPKSHTFGRYHVRYLNEHSTHEVDVLSGAFMLLRRTALDKAGLLDEQFFMYGEDIDLSYRIQKAGFVNVYFAGTEILHYKGESTKKRSANYVKVFYNAMVLFARKHYSGGSAGFFSLIIVLAVYLRAMAALAYRLFSRIWQPLLDFVLIYGGFLAITRYWELNNKFVRAYYPPEYFYFHLPAYILIILSFTLLSGGYDKPANWKRLLRGTLAGSLVVFSLYAFLPKELQFSRAILGLGCLWAHAAVVIWRVAVQLLSSSKFNPSERLAERWLLIGSPEECSRIRKLMVQANAGHEPVGSYMMQGDEDAQLLRTLAKITEASTLVFSLKDVSVNRLLAVMDELAESGLRFKTVPPGGNFIIGSESKEQPGNWYSAQHVYRLAQPYYRRKKRTLDILLALACFPLIPVLLLKRAGRKMLQNAGSVLAGKRTWAGYPVQSGRLPRIPVPVFDIASEYPLEAHPDWQQMLYERYASEYEASRDIQAVWEQLRA